MRRLLLFFSAIVALNVAAQLPAPAYEATFNGANWDTATGFTINTTNGTTSGADIFNTPYSAYNFYSLNGKLQLDAVSQTGLREKGTISFFAKYNNTQTSLTPIGFTYPIFYLNNGLTSWSEGLMLGFEIVAGAPKLMMKSYSAQYTGFSEQLNNAVSNTDWHHYIISYKFGNGGYINVYQDGKLVLTKDISHSLSNLTKPFEFFSHTSGSVFNRSATGFVDEIRAYTEPFNTAQAKEIYASYLKINSGSTIAKYSFDDDLTEHFGNYQPLNSFFGFNRYIATVSQGGNNTYVGNMVVGATAELPIGVGSILSEGSYTISLAAIVTGFTNNDNGEIMATVLSIPNTTGGDFLKIGMHKGTKVLRFEINESSAVSVNGTSLENWQHIVFSANNQNNTLSIYVNGALAATAVYNKHQFLNTLQNILLGKNRKPTPTYAVCAVDDLVIDRKTYNAVEAAKAYRQWKTAVTSYDTTYSTLGVDHIQKTQNNIKVYPNPTTDFVKLSQKADAEVYDLSGKLVGSYKNAEMLDLSTYQQGIYLLKLSNSKGTHSVKIIKK
ncbi:LamG-like jellyroll fold domain-containing protein [Chryseobacterium sp. MYb264]|uniref:LamG-like jellyroll fold domain-containing protein n=1 Tax=Chryseobacterium sp. MYb264 TaxID=2745153 RepID=UPI002E0F3544|nr:LamG-like jellyroll fold domain-containing protein [Chryseobacterium sp. MYb264]